MALTICTHGVSLRARRVLTQAVQAPGRDRAWACGELVQTFLRRGEADRAERHLRDVLDDSDPIQQYGLGYLFRRLGNNRDARAALHEALACRPRLWAANTEICWLEYLEGRTDEAERLVRAALRAFHKRDDIWGLSVCWSSLGTLDLVRFDLGSAVSYFRTALALKEVCGDASGRSYAQHNLGLALLAAGFLSRSARSFLHGAWPAERTRRPRRRGLLLEQHRYLSPRSRGGGARGVGLFEGAAFAKTARHGGGARECSYRFGSGSTDARPGSESDPLLCAGS